MSEKNAWATGIPVERASPSKPCLLNEDREVCSTHERQDGGQDRWRGFLNEESKAETDLQY
jgi:hypothetical protein